MDITINNKCPGKKYGEWNIPPDIDRHAAAKCPDGAWIECFVCKKWSPLNANQYRINTRTPYSWGLFNQHVLKNSIHRVNYEQNEAAKRIEARQQGKEIPPMKKQASLLSFYSKPSEKTKDMEDVPTDSTTSMNQQEKIVRNQSTIQGFMMKECLPKDKCRGIFEMKHFMSPSVQSGLEYSMQYYAVEKGRNAQWYVGFIGETSVMSVFSTSCMIDAAPQW